MRTFKDSENRTWEIAITIGTIKRVKGLADIDLSEPELGNPPLVNRLSVDVMLLCDVLYAIVQPQAEKLGVSDEQFGESLGGDAIITAHDAFWEEYAAFFQSIRRPHIVRVIEKQKAMVTAGIQAAERKIGQMDVEKLTAAIDRIDVNAVMEKAISDLPLNSPAPSASTPTHSPSAS